MTEPSPHKREARSSGEIVNAAALRFIGRLLTTVCHDLNNHLATLRESVGLGDDILQARHLTESEKLREMTRLIESLDGRVLRPALLVRSLTSFGGHLEAWPARADVNRAIEELLPLMEKSMARHSLSVRTKLKKSLPSVMSGPFWVQFLVFVLIENLFGRLEGGAAITISTTESPGAVVVGIGPDRATRPSADAPPWSREDIEALALQAGAHLEGDEGGAHITLRFPV